MILAGCFASARGYCVTQKRMRKTVALKAEVKRFPAKINVAFFLFFFYYYYSRFPLLVNQESRKTGTQHTKYVIHSVVPRSMRAGETEFRVWRQESTLLPHNASFVCRQHITSEGLTSISSLKTNHFAKQDNQSRAR